MAKEPTTTRHFSRDHLRRLAQETAANPAAKNDEIREAATRAGITISSKANRAEMIGTITGESVTEPIIRAEG